MTIGQIRNLTLAALSATMLSGCAVYSGYGTGYASDYYGDAYPDDCYDKSGNFYAECEDAGYVARSGYGFGNIFYHNNYGPYGWYDGFYYPGYSFYIFDRRGQRHRWGDNHRRHWEGRRGQWRSNGRRGRNFANRDQRRRDGRRNGRRNRDGAEQGAPVGQQGGNRRSGRAARRAGQGSGTVQNRPTTNTQPRTTPPPPANNRPRQTRRSRNTEQQNDPQ